MKRFFIALFHIILFIPCPASGQYVFSSEKWKEYLEEMAADSEDEDEGEARVEALYAELSYLADHPLDLNEATAGQLQKLPFLSALQVENILSFRARYGALVSIYELKNMEALDFRTIELMLPFVYVGERTVDRFPLTVENLLKYGKNTLLLKYDRCFQQKKGYRDYPDSLLAESPNRQYLGEPFYHSVRYSYTFRDKVQAGFTAEKDAGEPFWNRHHKGYDFYSFHFFLNGLGWLNSLALGDYRMSFGQGLVASTEFTPSKSATVTQMERRSYGFSRHGSTNENDFFRGAALSIRWKNMDMSAFYSFRPLDATVTDGAVSSLKTDGLHRLPGERAKKGVLNMQTFGGNLHYLSPGISVGLTAVSCSFLNYAVMPVPKPYNLFYFRGNRNLNMSVDYSLHNHLLKFYGETAMSANKAVATLNALQCTPVPELTFLMLHRYYGKRYQAFLGNAFSQSSSVQNEEGIYAGVRYTPFVNWTFSGYADRFRFPWPNYGVDAPSSGAEYMARIDYSGWESASFYIRYKCRQKEKNVTPAAKATADILPYVQHRLRLQTQYRLRTIDCKTSADGIVYTEESNRDKGFMLAQSAGWNPSSLPVQLSLHAAWFHTESYNTRLSSYEKNILYACNTPQLYGKGIRLSAVARWDLQRRLSLFAKLGDTRHADRETTGSNLEEIEGPRKTDLLLLLRWKY